MCFAFPCFKLGTGRTLIKETSDIFFVSSLSVFQQLLRKCESSFLELSLLWHTSVSHTLTAPQHKGGPSLHSQSREHYVPCQTKCWAQCTMPALALFTQNLIKPPAWEWTSENGVSWSLWITFYSGGFPTVLVREKAQGTWNVEKDVRSLSLDAGFLRLT